MLPKDFHTLISRTCDYATLYGKGDFTYEIKDFEMEKLSWIFQVSLI